MMFWGFDRATGALSAQQIIPSVPPGFTGTDFTSEIRVSADGNFVYGANRLNDTISVFKIGHDGSLTQTGHVSTLGDYPRIFAIVPQDGSWRLGISLVEVGAKRRVEHIRCRRARSRSAALSHVGFHRAPDAAGVVWGACDPTRPEMRLRATGFVPAHAVAHRRMTGGHRLTVQPDLLAQPSRHPCLRIREVDPLGPNRVITSSLYSKSVNSLFITPTPPNPMPRRGVKLMAGDADGSHSSHSRCGGVDVSDSGHPIQALAGSSCERPSASM